MKIKPSTGTSLTNKKTTPPTVGKISKPKRFKGKSKTSGSKLTSTPKTPKGGKKELLALKSSSQKNKKISPELNLGLKIEKILENGGPNVIRLNSESETPKTSLAKKKVKNEGTEVQNLKKKVKRTKKEDTDASELSDKSISPTPKQKKKINSTDRTGDHESHSQQEGKKKAKLNKKQLPQSMNKLETEPSSSDAGCQSNEETDEDSEEKEKHIYSWDVPSQFNLDHDKVLNAVNALIERTKKKYEMRQKAELFDSNTEPIFLQVATVKKAACPKRMLRFTLPHSLVHDLTDVCLIVQNIKGHRKDNEGTIEHYKELFEKNNVTGIKEIIAARMLTEEYQQFEMKRKLRDRFDIFLADSRISHFLVKELGKFFAYTKKHPIPVRLSAGDLKENVSKALRKTQMKISPDSDIFTAVVAHMAQSAEEIADNVYAVAEALAESLPGNWPNVRALYLTSTGLGRGFPLPVYISLLSPNSVPVPVMEPPKKKGDIIVEDELSTLPGARVKVMPDGTVHVLRDKPRKSSVSDAEDEEILAIAAKHKQEARSSRIEDAEHIKPKKKSEKIVQEAEEKFVQLYKGNLDDIDIDEDNNNDSGNKDNGSIDDDNMADDGENVENGIDNSHVNETANKPQKRKSSAHPVETKKAKKLKKPKQVSPEQERKSSAHPVETKKAKKLKKPKQVSPEDENDGDDGDDGSDETEHKIKQKKPKGERVVKTNWIKSTKKMGAKKMSKSQRKAKIKTKNVKN